MKNVELKNFGTADELAAAAAQNWIGLIESSHGTHNVALSGGRITKVLFSKVVEQVHARTLKLDRVHFFWADERCLPPNDSESNFRPADELLFQPLGIAASNIHRLRGELDPQDAVVKANEEISKIVSRNAENLPVLDLVLLGMGEDGHVASLFPNASEEVIHCTRPYLAIDNSPKPPPRRLSLSYGAIVAAKEVWVLVSGAGKETALRESLQQKDETPLARVLRSRAKTTLYADIK